MAIINIFMTLAQAGEPFISYLKGGERIRAVEVRDGDKRVSLKAFRHHFQEVVTQDSSGTTRRESLFQYRGSAEAQDTLALIERVYQAFRTEGTVESRKAEPVHHPRNDGGTEAIDPVATIREVQLYYPDPIGEHGEYHWHFRNWNASSSELMNPLIRKLVADKARVFPRYARKAFGRYQPGDFVGLGGPDAYLFRGDPDVVAFIRRHTALRVVLPTEAEV